MPPETTGQSASKRRTFLRAALLVLGAALLVLAIAHLHPREVFARIEQIGWMFVPAAACWLLLVLFSALGWRETLEPEARRVPFTTLFRALLIGAAVNEMTPTGAIGEVLKGALLRGRVQSKDVVSSIVLYNYVTGATIVGWSLVGLGIAVFVLALPPYIEVVAITVAAALIIGLIGFRFLLRRGISMQVIRIVRRLPFVHFDAARAEEQAKSADEGIRRFHRQRPGAFIRAIVFAGAARLAEVLEVAVLLVALVPERSLGWIALFSIVVQTASQLLKYAVIVVPGQLGFLETGTAILFRIAGLGAAPGLALELLRRARKILALAVAMLLAAPMMVPAGSRKSAAP